jgi:hypothetical protein
LASLGVSLEGRSSSQGDSVDLELRHCVSEGTLSELDLAHVSKCALGRQQGALTRVLGLCLQGHTKWVGDFSILEGVYKDGNRSLSRLVILFIRRL